MSKRVILWSLSILVSALLTGCSDSPTEPDADPLELQLVLNDASVSPSESLDMRLIVTNRGREEVQLVLWGCMSNFQIYRGSERVWDLASRVACPFGTTSVVIQPGESLRYAASWNVRGANGEVPPPGLYEARAQLLTNEPMSSPAVSFRVEG